MTALHGPARPAAGGAPRALRAEVERLRAQRGARAVLVACLLGPALLVVALRLQGTPPRDTLFGRQVLGSGLAPSLFLLAFAGQWLLPLLAGLVGGDVVAAEDRHGTWGTLLTRSVDRREVFAGKAALALGWAAAVVTALALGSLLAGLLLVRGGALSGLSGQPVGTGTGVLLVLGAWLSVLPATLGFAALGLLASTLTRSSAAGVAAPAVAGLLMSLLALVPHGDPLRHLLLSTPLGTWHGLLTAPRAYGPLLRGWLVGAGWTAGCLVLARRALLRRDLTGG